MSTSKGSVTQLRPEPLLNDIPDFSGKESIVLETITPVLARQYLELGMKNNRQVNANRVKAYARDMTQNAWHLHGAAIQFDVDGRLIDGQHRLWAVVQSGKDVQMLVMRNVKSEALHVIDRGQSRTIHQALQISGLEINKNEVAIGRAMRINCTSAATNANKAFGAVSAEDELTFADMHLQAIKFAAKVYGKKKDCCNNSFIRSVVGRAYLTDGVDKERLVAFLYCLDTGKLTDVKADEGARLVRDYYYANRAKAYVSPVEIVQKTCYGLKHFLDSKAPNGLRVMREDPFVILTV